MVRLRGFILTIMMVLFFLFPATIHGVMNIVESGSYNINASDVGSVIIDADDVTLNLQNFTLESSGVHGVEILAGHKNIRIKNGSINGDSGFDGIFTNTGCELITIEDITICSCDNGIQFGGSALRKIKSCEVKNCKFCECNKGVYANYLIKSIFENCQASNCVFSGFEQENSQFNVFDRCKSLKTGEGSTSSDNVVGFLSSAGTGNLYTECVAEGTNKASSDVNADVSGFVFLNTEKESKIINSIANSTSLIGSATAYGIYIGSTVSTCLIDSNKACNTIGNATGIFGDSNNNVFVKNLAYNNDTNYSSGITNVFTEGLLSDPNLLDNISLPGVSTVVSCPDSITSSGVYVVDRADLCGIFINADDVYLDLQGYTIQATEIVDGIRIVAGHKNIWITNGAINVSSIVDGISVGAGCEFVRIDKMNIYGSQNGINFNGSSGNEIKSCSVENCNFHECNKGLFASYLIKSVFNNCCAQNCVLSGFEQVNCQFNVFDKCKALKTGEGSSSSDSVIGFSSSAGTGNLYTECVAEGTSKISSDVGADVYAFSLLTTETESKIIDCIANSTSLIGSATAYGIYIGSTVSTCLIDSNKVCNTAGNATGIFGDSDNNVFIKNLAYNNDINYSSGVTNVFTEGLLSDPNLLDNISLPGVSTVVSCPDSITSSGVYVVDRADLCGIFINADDVYLDLQGYTIQATEIVDGIRIVAGHKNIWITNGAINVSSIVDGISVGAGCEFVRIDKMNIYGSQNGINFNGSSGNEIKSCSVENCNFHECNKGLFASYLIKSVFNNCCAQNCVLSGFEQVNCQFNVFDKCKALKTGEGSSSSDSVIGFSSSAGTGNLYTECVAEGTSKISSDVGADVYAFSLLTTETESKIIDCIANSTSLIGSATAYGIYIGSTVSTCLIDSNKVCNTAGNATGIFGDSDNNVFIKNLAYNNDINYSSGVTNVFTEGLLSDPNLLDNISLPGTTMVASCPNTITVSGVYTLDTDDTCCIVIDADDVYLDLQGYTLNCTTTHAIQILSGHTNIWIKNGSVNGNNSNTGILVNHSCEFVRIEDITVYDCQIGLCFDGSSDSKEIKSCAVVNCNFNSSFFGVKANSLIKSIFNNCCAQNCEFAGFSQENSQFNVFDNCNALQTSGTGLAFGFRSESGIGNFYARCVAEGTNAVLTGGQSRTCGFEISEEQETKIIRSVANSTFSVSGSGFSIGIFVDNSTSCVIEENKVCNTTGSVPVLAFGIVGNSNDSLFIKNIAYNNDTNFSPSVINVFTDGLAANPKLLDNISLPGSLTAIIDPCADVINVSGVYNIDSTGNCCIVIDADDVFLNLNGHTLSCSTNDVVQILSGHKNIIIKNGAIKGDGSNNGIVVNDACESVNIEQVNIYNCDIGLTFSGALGSEVKACSVVDCNFHECTKGVECQYCKKMVFENCSAKNCDEIGFDQVRCSYNVYRGCNALDISSNDSAIDAIGFNSLGGMSNLYYECNVEGVSNSTDATWTTIAAGFNFGYDFNGTDTASEMCSKVKHCCVDSIVSSSFGQAFGIRTDLALESVASIVAEDRVNDSFPAFFDFAESLDWSPRGDYIGIFSAQSATVNVPGEIRVLRFNGSELSTVFSYNDSDQGSNVQAGIHFSPDGKYLLAGLRFTGARILIFDVSKFPDNTPVDTAAINDSVYGIRWFNNCRKFVTSNPIGADEFIRIYSFDEESGTISLLQSSADIVNSRGSVDVSFDDKFIVSRGADGVRIIDPNDLTVLAGPVAGSTDGRVYFNPVFCCGVYYLVVVSNNNNRIQIVKFDSVTNTLTSLQIINGSDIDDARWSPDGRYLSVSEDNLLKIYEFNPENSSSPIGSSPILTYDPSPVGTTALLNIWSPCGRYVSLVGDESGGVDAEILQVGDTVTGCLIDDNRVVNCSGGLCGVGILGGTYCNGIFRNITFRNNVNFSKGIFNKSIANAQETSLLNNVQCANGFGNCFCN